MLDTHPIAASAEDTRLPYKGAIRVVWINDSGWMRAGDLGTIRNTIAALAPVAGSVEVSSLGFPGDTGSFDHIDTALFSEQTSASRSPVCDTWRQNVAEILRPVTEVPDSGPVVFVSTGQLGLRVSSCALRGMVAAPILWLDVQGDYVDTVLDDTNFPVDFPVINAFLSKEYIDLYKCAEHIYTQLPYLPERRDLPLKEEARARLRDRYGLTFERPLMAVLLGGDVGYQEDVANTARAFSADLAVLTSPRTAQQGHRWTDYRDKWRGSARVFHEFGKSEGANPYADIVAAADYIAADGDSLSMPADVMGLGTPVALFAGDLSDLVQNGFATTLNGARTAWRPPPPHETSGALLNRVVRTELAKLVSG